MKWTLQGVREGSGLSTVGTFATKRELVTKMMAIRKIKTPIYKVGDHTYVCTLPKD